MAVEHFSLSGEPEGELNIGIMETICASEFVNLFQNFSLNYHQVSLNLQIVTTHQALDMLEKGKFDLIFLLDNKISRPDMVTAREYPVDISFFCASGHPLASQKDITLEQLLQEQRSLPWYGQLMTTPQTIAYFLQISYWMRKYHVSIV